MSKTNDLARNFLPRVLLPLFILAVGLYMFIVSFSYEFTTRAFASAISAILIALSATAFVKELVRGRAALRLASDTSAAEGPAAMPAIIISLAACAAFFVASVFIGLIFSVPLWVFSVLLLTRAERKLAVIIPLVLWGVMKFGFEWGLGFFFFRGILFGDKLGHFW